MTSGPGKDRLVHGGNGRVPRRVELLDESEESESAETGRAHDLGAGQQAGEHHSDEPVDVEQRHHVEAAILRSQ